MTDDDSAYGKYPGFNKPLDPLSPEVFDSAVNGWVKTIRNGGPGVIADFKDLYLQHKCGPTREWLDDTDPKPKTDKDIAFLKRLVEREASVYEEAARQSGVDGECPPVSLTTPNLPFVVASLKKRQI